MEESHPPDAAPDSRALLRGAGRNFGWMLASRGVQAVLSLAYLAIAARALGVADFGRFALVVGAAQALALFVGFQTWQIVVQYGVAHLARGDEPALGRLLRLCGLLDLASALAGAMLAGLIVLGFGGTLGIGADMAPAALLFAIVQLLALRSTPLGMLRLRDKFSLGALADSMTPAVRFIGSLLALLLSPTVPGFLAAWAAAEIATAAAYWILVARSRDLRLLWNARLGRRLILEENPGLARFALSTNATSTLNLSGKQVPLLLVGAYVGPVAAGTFRLAYQLAQALTKLSQLLARAAFPEIVRVVHGAGARILRVLLGKLMLAAIGVAALILLLVWLVGEPVLLLVGGPGYRQAYPVLLWLAVAGCLDLATTAFEPILMAIHRAGTAFLARAMATAVLLGLLVTLTPAYGALGAAAAVVAGSLVAALLLGIAAFLLVGRAARAGP